MATALDDTTAAVAAVALSETKGDDVDATAQGAEDAADLTALQENLDNKGQNAYYYAHKDREKSQEFDRNHGGGMKIDGKNYGGAPQLLVRQATPSERARPLCTIDKFAWADEDNRVKIYVMMDGLADIGDDQVAMDWEEQSLELRITDLGGKDHVLTIPNLHDKITKATCKKTKTKILITCTKSISVKWYQLKQSSN